jgi:hypothetical protein
LIDVLRRRPLTDDGARRIRVCRSLLRKLPGVVAQRREFVRSLARRGPRTH